MCSEFLSGCGILLIGLTIVGIVIGVFRVVINYSSLCNKVTKLQYADNDLMHVGGTTITKVNQRLDEIESKLNKRGKQ